MRAERAVRAERGGRCESCVAPDWSAETPHHVAKHQRQHAVRAERRILCLLLSSRRARNRARHREKAREGRSSARRCCRPSARLRRPFEYADVQTLAFAGISTIPLTEVRLFALSRPPAHVSLMCPLNPKSSQAQAKSAIRDPAIRPVLSAVLTGNAWYTGTVEVVRESSQYYCMQCSPSIVYVMRYAF